MYLHRCEGCLRISGRSIGGDGVPLLRHPSFRGGILSGRSDGSRGPCCASGAIQSQGFLARWFFEPQVWLWYHALRQALPALARELAGGHRHGRGLRPCSHSTGIHAGSRDEIARHRTRPTGVRRAVLASLGTGTSLVTRNHGAGCARGAPTTGAGRSPAHSRIRCARGSEG